MTPEQATETLKEILTDTGYTFYFENVSITINNKHIEIIGNKNNMTVTDNTKPIISTNGNLLGL